MFKENYKCYKRIISVIVAVILIMCAVPFSLSAAPASDIPAEMLDNVFLDALAYTGYNVQAQKDNGTIFKQYTSAVPASIRSNISYGTGPSGLETVANVGTCTGLAPNIPYFESGGLCCASYISYVYFNYLPNIAGIDTSSLSQPANPRSASSYKAIAENWAASGKARIISFSQNSNGSNFIANESIPIGSLIVFKSISSGGIAHVAIYAGYYNGLHFVTHVGNSRGPEFCTISGMSKGSSPQMVALIVAPEAVKSNGVIEIYKRDTDGRSLAGAVFVATDDVTGEQYIIGPTDTNGYAKSKDALPFGNYTVRETVFPTNHRGYGQTEWRVILNSNNNGVVVINAVNEIIPGSIEIVKRSEDNIVDGIDFRITGNGVDKTVTTSNGGKFIITDLKPGEYTVTENTKKYYEPQEAKTVTVSSGQTATVTFNNTLKRGKIRIYKKGEIFSSVAETDGMYQPVYKESYLENATFSVTAAEDIYSPDGVLLLKRGTIVDTITTDADGIAETKSLHFGKYEIMETKAPFGMVLNDKVYTAELTLEGEQLDIVAEKTVSNIRQKAKISLLKELETDGTFCIGNNKEILNVEFGLFAAEDIIAADQSYIPKDGLIEMKHCDENGELEFETDVPVGAKLYVKEIATDEHYILSDEKYYIEFEYKGENTEIVSLPVSGGKQIENKLIKGEIIGKKTDEDGNAVAGAVFGLFKPDEVECTENTAIIISKSDENGVFEFLNVPFGDYIIKEIKSPQEYVLNENRYTVSITADRETVEVQIENRFITGSVQVRKIDWANPKNQLSGAVFDVYIDADNNRLFDKNIDAFVGELKETEKGIYVLENLRYNGYFLHEKTAPEGYIKDDGYYYFEIRNDGETAKVETRKGYGFVNKPIDMPSIPKTGDSSLVGFFIGLAAIALGGIVACGIMYFKSKHDDLGGDDDE